LDLTNLDQSELALTGIGYILPVKVAGNWQTIILFKSFKDAKGNENLNHFDWWDSHVAALFAGKNRLDEEDSFEINMSYTGVPRFRVELVDDIYKIYYGKNICNKIKTRIIQTVGLRNKDYEFVYDDHETMDKEDKSVIQTVLNFTYPKPYC